MKELWKSVKIWQSDRHEFGGPVFLERSANVNHQGPGEQLGGSVISTIEVFLVGAHNRT